MIIRIGQILFMTIEDEHEDDEDLLAVGDVDDLLHHNFGWTLFACFQLTAIFRV